MKFFVNRNHKDLKQEEGDQEVEIEVEEDAGMETIEEDFVEGIFEEGVMVEVIMVTHRVPHGELCSRFYRLKWVVVKHVAQSNNSRSTFLPVFTGVTCNVMFNVNVCLLIFSFLFYQNVNFVDYVYSIRETDKCLGQITLVYIHE